MTKVPYENLKFLIPEHKPVRDHGTASASKNYCLRANACRELEDIIVVGIDVPVPRGATAKQARRVIKAAVEEELRKEFADDRPKTGRAARKARERKGRVEKLMVPLPNWVNKEQARELCRRLLNAYTQDGKAIGFGGIHTDHANNLHFHGQLMDRLESREVAEGRKDARGGRNVKRQFILRATEWDSSKEFSLVYMRVANDYLRAIGKDHLRIEVRSFEELGITDRLATEHVGPAAGALRAKAEKDPSIFDRFKTFFASEGPATRNLEKERMHRFAEATAKKDREADAKLDAAADVLLNVAAAKEMAAALLEEAITENSDGRAQIDAALARLAAESKETEEILERLANERDRATTRAERAERDASDKTHVIVKLTGERNDAQAALEPTQRLAEDLERAVADVERYLGVDLGTGLPVSRRVETLLEAAERRRREDAKDARKEIDRLTTALTAAQEAEKKERERADREKGRADGEKKRADTAEALLQRGWQLARSVALALAERVEALVKGGVLALVSRMLPEQPERILPNAEKGVPKLREMLAQGSTADEARTEQPAPQPKLAPAPINVVPLDADERRLEAAAKIPPRVPETVILRFANKGEVFQSIEQAELWVYRQIRQHGSIAKYGIEYGRGAGVSKHPDLAAARAERVHRDRPVGGPDLVIAR